MTLEVEYDNPDQIRIYVNNTILRFLIYEFAPVTELKCSNNETISTTQISLLVNSRESIFSKSSTNVKRGELVKFSENIKWDNNI